MNIRTTLGQLPLRLTTGSYFLNSGLSKWNADEDAAKYLENFAASAYPFLAKLPPKLFVRTLSATELAIATALLLPVVPATVAGAALAAFSAGLVGLYLRSPGLRQPGSLRPTEQGIALSKDVWLTAIGVSLVISGATSGRRRRRRR